jgi:hypothetical protein
MTASIRRTTASAGLPGPARTAHQTRSITVRVDALDGGMMRLSQPGDVRGWAVVARTPMELARGLGEAFREAQLANYARWRGAQADQDALTDHVPGDPLAPPRPTSSRKVPRRAPHRSDTHDPRAWVAYDDGTWCSPTGRRYGGQTSHVQRVMHQRVRLGLPPVPAALAEAPPGPCRLGRYRNTKLVAVPAALVAAATPAARPRTRRHHAPPANQLILWETP